MDLSSAASRTTAGPPYATAPEMSGSAVRSWPTEPRADVARTLLARASVALAVATVLAQISYPLLTGEVLRVTTVATVLLFAAASLTHAAASRGPAAAWKILLAAGGVSLLAEAVGVATGLPFGRYAYADTLGPQLLGVPLLVPLAWTMTAYPCLLLGRRLARGRRAVAVVAGAAALASWDLFLDPQMVAAGHWTWQHPTPALPGVPGIPLTNYAGWLLVSLLLMAALDRTVPGSVPGHGPGHGPGRAGGEAVPAALLAWTWLGSGVGNLVYFDRPAVAGYGVLAMGVTVLPYLCLVSADLVPGGPRGGRR